MDLGSKDLALEVEVIGTDAVAQREAVPAVGSRSRPHEFVGHDGRPGIQPHAVIDVERSDGSDEGGARPRVAEPPPGGRDLARGWDDHEARAIAHHSVRGPLGPRLHPATETVRGLGQELVGRNASAHVLREWS